MIVGADGSSSGWVVAAKNRCGKIVIKEVGSIQAIFEHWDVQTLAIDMIIGIPEQTQRGGRRAEREARKLLSPRGAVVFSTPCRAAVYASDYVQALELSRQSSPQNIGLSKQSYNITPKIRELDLFLRKHSKQRDCIFEVHPELSFWEMNKREQIPTKHSPEGRKKRMELLEEQGLLQQRSVSIDEMDALACLYSAIRIQSNQADCVPLEPVQDAFGLSMQICW